jgi:glycosyltransferase involved in cell wall biosynthesis
MKSDRHIVILTPGFPKNEKDENCMPYMHVFIEYLNANYKGYYVSIITLQYPHHEIEYSWNNIPVYGCGGHDRKFPRRILTWLRCLKYFKRINAIKRVHIIHSFWLNECAWLGNHLSKKYNTKHLCTLMGQDVKRPNIYFNLLPLRQMHLVAVSNFQKKVFFEQTGLQAAVVIPWGINPNSEFINNSNPDIDVLGVGSLLPIKNYTLFIELIKDLKKDYPSLKTVLIGDGPDKKKLVERIKALDLENTISLPGTLPRKEVLGLMLQSKVLLHTSKYESFGYVFSEALASGMSIVSFEVGIAQHAKGWKVCHSYEEMIEALKFFIKENRMPRKLPVEYTIEETANKYIEIYNSLDK